MNEAFCQNNVHSVSAKILLDVSSLTETQLANILEISHIESVCLDLIANAPIRINDNQSNVKIDSISVNVSDSFRRTLINSNLLVTKYRIMQAKHIFYRWLTIMISWN